MVAEYMNKMRLLSDEMAMSGRPLEEDELVEYILTGLNYEYDHIVSAVIARQTLVSLSELCSTTRVRDSPSLMSAQHGGGSLVNAASHGCGCGHGRGSFGHGPSRDSPSGGGGRGGYNRGHGGCGGFGCRSHNYFNEKRPLCQVCKKKGHMTDRY
jgi:hypothetical protein